MPPSRSAARDRVLYGRIVRAFIHAGWNPPRPNDEQTRRLAEAIENAHPGAKLDLSPTQSRLLELLADGLTYDQIAAELGLSRSMLREHQKASFRRLGARNGPHAVAIGFRRGMLV